MLYYTNGLATFRLLRLSGDVESNPGPEKSTRDGVKQNSRWRYPCGECTKPVKNNQNGILCSKCSKWFHIKCIGMSVEMFRSYYLPHSDENWLCCTCFANVIGFVFRRMSCRLFTCYCKSTWLSTQFECRNVLLYRRSSKHWKYICGSYKLLKFAPSCRPATCCFSGKLRFYFSCYYWNVAQCGHCWYRDWLGWLYNRT